MKASRIPLYWLVSVLVIQGMSLARADDRHEARDPRAASANPPSAPAGEAVSAHDADMDAILTRAAEAVRSSHPTPDVDILVEEALRKCYVTRDRQCNAAIDLNDRKWKEEFSQRSYDWHLFSAKLIFFLVIAIVLFGLYVTYLQFNRDYRDWSALPHHPGVTPAPGAPSDAPAADSMPPRPVSSLKLSAGGLELSSQVIGLIVLALSFAFFYLYVKEIHPMVEIHSELVPPMSSTQK
jgi:hypothetical protein